MDCLKACPHTSVEFNLRPPGVDLWTTHKPAVSEVALMFMLLGGGVVFVSTLSYFSIPRLLSLRLNIHKPAALMFMLLDGGVVFASTFHQLVFLINELLIVKYHS
jgi:polyferredoxin